MTELKREAIRIAQEWISAGPVYLDTETTGLSQLSEVCDIAVIDHDGTVLLDTLVKTVEPIPAAATAIHHITTDMVQSAPTIAAVMPELQKRLHGRLTVVYNSAYDLQMIKQSLAAYDIATAQMPPWDLNDFCFECVV